MRIPSSLLALTIAVSTASFVSAQAGAAIPEEPVVVARHAWEVLKEAEFAAAAAAATDAEDVRPTACEVACASIASLFPDKIHYQNHNRAFSLWDTKQDELTPTCRYEPADAREVSMGLRVAIIEECPFAIKSGGVARIAGASSVNGGILFDLAKNLNEVTVSEDKKSVTLGAGGTWGKVYGQLQEQNITVIGGRVSHVGVGGLLLGGGVSFFTERHGWGCDNILEYEIVTPDGLTNTVTYESDPDLFWALRGGGNNFGIVTKFTVNAYPQGELFGGSIAYTQDKFDEVLDGYGRMLEKKHNTDLDADAWISFGYHPEYKIVLGVLQLMHAVPEMNPEVYKEISEIHNMSSSLRVAPLTNFTDEIALWTPPGLRNLYRAIAFEANTEINKKILQLFLEEIEPLKDLVGSLPSFILQPISLNAVSHMDVRGGNALGLHGIEKDHTLFSIAFTYYLASDDALVEEVALRFFDRATKLIRKEGAMHRFVYSNYAHSDQDVYRGYGVKNFERLHAVAERVDPKGVFAKGGLVDGPFKIQVKEEVIKEEVKERVRDEL